MNTADEERPASTRTIDPEDDIQRRSRQRKMRWAAIVGTAVEWYDFYLYAAMASIVFATVFFPESETAALQSFATFAVGFIARPIGGMLFGALGDKIGRKRTLVITFSLMGVATGCIGLLPGYGTLGIWAPILLVVLRIAQGLGAGAEFASAAVASYEHADEHNRGSLAAMPALGMNIGLILSSLTVVLLSLAGEDFLLNGGWRIPFAASFVLVAVGLWVRAALPETPDFVINKESKRLERIPLLHMVRSEWRGLLVVIVIALGYTSISYIFKTFSLAYLAAFSDVSATVSSMAVALAGTLAVVVIPSIGRLCDRWSSRKVIMLGGMLSATWAFIFLALLQEGTTTSVMCAIIVGSGLIVPLMITAQGSFYSRQFPVATRASGVGTAREFGTAISGAVAPLGALALVMASPSHSTFGVGIVLLVSGALVVAPAFFDQGRRYSTHRN